MRLSILLIIFLLPFSLCKSQNDSVPSFASRLIAGASLTYLPDRNPTNTYFHGELTGSLNLAISASRSLYFGINTLWIFTHSRSVPSNSYQIFGPFVQYDFLRKNRHMVYAELSLNYGNYCTCTKVFEYPYKQSNLYYLGLGGGAKLNNKKRINFDLGFSYYLILNSMEYKYAYFRYLVGISYQFDLRK